MKFTISTKVRNHCSIFDRMPFGVHKGTEIGLIYFFDAPYLEWALKTVDNFCLYDIEILSDIEVFTIADVAGSVMLSGVGRDLAIGNSRKDFTFLDLIYSGRELFYFSAEAIESNEIKVKRGGGFDISRAKKRINSAAKICYLRFLEEDVMEQFAMQRDLTFYKIKINSKGKKIIVFKFDKLEGTTNSFLSEADICLGLVSQTGDYNEFVEGSIYCLSLKANEIIIETK